MSKEIRHSGRFAEVEYCLQKYFDTYMTPVMREVKSGLEKKQAEEIGEFASSPAGLLRSFTGGVTGMPDDTVQYLRLTGEWNSKTAEDYVAMCRKRIAGDKGLASDLALLAGEWRNAVVAEIGRERYDGLSKKLGCDLAFAYVDYRVEQMMIDRMVADRMPKSSVEYVLRKGMDGSLFGFAGSLQESPLEREINTRSEAAYRPSTTEKVAGRALSFGVDAVTTGGVASWAGLAGNLGLEAASYGVEWYLEGKEKNDGKALTVEDCISRGVFGSEKNVFKDFRKKGKSIVSYENEYILSVNERLNKPMGIATKKPFWAEMAEQSRKPGSFGFSPFQSAMTGEERDDERYKDVPMIVAPGQEDEYLRTVAEVEAQEKEAQKKNGTGTEEESQEQTPEAGKKTEETAPEARQTTNESGWDGLLRSFGLDGMEDIGKNLGYVIAMLPDVLIGLFTGNTRSFGVKDSLLPVASILLGMFVKNPLLKLTLIGMGGLNLLNKAGHEALDDREAPQKRLFKPYPDEPLSPRLANPVLQGNILLMDMDGVPCSILLPEAAAEACRDGALPLNTLANAVLAKHEETRLMAQENYRISERTLEDGKEKAMTLK